ncbi:cysteine hydrolase family protein [Streptomyces sp. TRM64462]|uniref:cysteine hydrolase family protein n=1 Tax=Streptomyces sp. TRM64462 TaxID=2741726 RepID=UPI0015868C74|nr:isochorismatase family cysteine hydrolase [Streptomyces sp. TRM64462]
MSDARLTSDPYLVPHLADSALVTIDLQRDFLSDSPYGIPGTTEVLPRVLRLVEEFRAAGRPVLHIVRLYEKGGGNADLVRRTLLADGTEIVAPGSPGSALAPGLAPEGAPALDPDRLLRGPGHQQLGPREYAVYKPRWGAFYRTSLEGLLAGFGVDTLVFAGCNLPNCPRASIIEASERDFRVVAVEDALSRTSEQGLAELSGIGVQLLTTDELTALLAETRP